MPNLLIVILPKSLKTSAADVTKRSHISIVQLYVAPFRGLANAFLVEGILLCCLTDDVEVDGVHL